MEQKKGILKDSPIPVYYQIYMNLKSRILNRELMDETGKLPPERQLAADYEVSRVTMRQSMAELEKDGLIIRCRGLGSFAKTKPKPLFHNLDLPGQVCHQSVRGYIDKNPEILELSCFETTYDHISQALGYEGRIYYIKRLMRVDKNPIAVNRIWLPEKFTPGIDKTGLCIEGSLSKTLDQVYHLKVARRENIVEALRPSDSERELLKITRDTLILQIKSTSFQKDGVPYEYSATSWIGDAIRLKIDVSDIEHVLEFSGKGPAPREVPGKE